ncbi:DUF389 domain-containing protein [Paraoerskovia marina]|uniref:DUF389 domain-containing protein n=1 Tax=Paraoerskovia marina TaxID=545619 RepID=UPI00069463C5|nr:DUF389 domain-containing protein [Paraoerskovia marina]
MRTHERVVGLVDGVRERFDPVTIKGAAMIAVGLVVVLLPSISVSVISALVGVAIAASGCLDLWASVARTKGRRIRRSIPRRVLLGLRGVGSLVVSLFFLVSTQGALNLVVTGFGVYLFFHGVIGLVSGLGSPRERVGQLAGGAMSTAFGTIFVVNPSIASEGLILAGATATALIGVVVLAYGIRHRAGSGFAPLANPSPTEILWAWVKEVEVGEDRRAELVESLYAEPPDRTAKVVGWWVMLILSVCIATFAVLQDSTAVVIGAMLVAPLMVPILGLAGALVNGWARRAVSSTLFIVGGAAAAIATSAAISAWAPAVAAFDTNSQITSRVNPTLLDLLIALAAGAAGAYATLDRRVGSSIGGVAIAVALVPPLAVVGITAQAGLMDEAWGAFLLFLTNFVAIVLAASLVFAFGGFASFRPDRKHVQKIALTLAPFVTLALVVFVPLLLTTEGLIAQSADQSRSEDVVDDWLDDADTDLALVDVSVADDVVEVDLVGSDDAPDPDDLQSSLTTSLGRSVGVTISVTPTVVTHVDAG